MQLSECRCPKVAQYGTFCTFFVVLCCKVLFLLGALAGTVHAILETSPNERRYTVKVTMQIKAGEVEAGDSLHGEGGERFEVLEVKPTGADVRLVCVDGGGFLVVEMSASEELYVDKGIALA